MAVQSGANGRVSVKVTIDQTALARMTSHGGVVDRYTVGKARVIASKARQFAPVKSGRLRGSIKVAQARDVGGRFTSGYEVAAEASYAKYVHEGTRPHEIRGNPLLVFKIGDQTIFTPKVNHPGTRANPFLQRAVEVVMAGTR